MKLNQEQKNAIAKRYGQVANLIIANIEWFGNIDQVITTEKELEEAIEIAIDIIKTRAE